MNLIDKDAVVATIKKHVEEERHSYFCKCLLSEIDALKVKEQPQLPSNLDEAAEEYIKFKPRYDIQQELEEGEDPTEIECFTIDAAIDSFKAGAKYEKGRADALKDLPRWNDSRWIYEDGWLQDGFLYYRNHSIPLKDLEKLPGFKEDSHE